MSAALVQKTPRVKTGFVDTVDLVFPGNVTAGNLIVINIGVQFNVPSNSVTDTLANTYHKIDELTGDGESCSEWYAENIAGGACTVTLNPSGGGDLIAGVASEWSGIVTSSSLSTFSSRQQSSTTAAATNNVSANAGDLIIATFVPCDSTEQWTPGGSQSVVDADMDTAGGFATISADYRIPGANGTYSLSWSGTTARNCDTVVAVFAASGGGGGGTPKAEFDGPAIIEDVERIIELVTFKPVFIAPPPSVVPFGFSGPAIIEDAPDVSLIAGTVFNPVPPPAPPFIKNWGFDGPDIIEPPYDWAIYEAVFKWGRKPPLSVAGKLSLLEVWNLVVRLDVKQAVDSGSGVANASDVSGTTFTFNKPFKSVASVVATTQETNDFACVIDFVAIPNPTTFKVYVFNTAGVRATKTIYWVARGII